MSTLMAEERDSTSHAPPRMYCIDNGTMIGLLGYIELKSGRKTPFESSGIDQYMRTDDTVINWS
jgi:tRNA A37 threonylcarbamoyltransferase TsaD